MPRLRSMWQEISDAPLLRASGRATQGVIVFNTAEGEKVASVERLSEEGGESGEE